MDSVGVFSFNEQLQMSNGVSHSKTVESILLEALPGAKNVVKAHEVNDKNGVDYWVEMPGKFVSVDCKIRAEDYFKKSGFDDLALETHSVIIAKTPVKVGWTRDINKQTDYILWFWQDTGRWCLIPFQMLCKVFQEKWLEWSTLYKKDTQTTKTSNNEWQSECVFVPRRIVWAEIYHKFSGVPV